MSAGDPAAESAFSLRPRAGPVAALLALAMASGVVAPRTGAAQGFSLWEQGNCALGRGGAAVAAPCDDGSAIFFNPAGLVGREGWTLSVGGHRIAARGSFTGDRLGTETDLDNPVTPVPHAYLRYGFDDALAAGVGLYAPFGLETRWPRDFTGAFLGFENVLRTIHLQPTVAYRPLDGLSVGGGVTVAVSSVELNRLLDLSAQPLPEDRAPFPGATFGQVGIPFHTPFARARLDAGGATDLGFHVGAIVRLREDVRLGARYMSGSSLEYEGEASFSPVPTGITLPAENPFDVPAGTPLDDVLRGRGLFEAGGLLETQDVSAKIDAPDIVVVGVAARPWERLLVAVDWSWMNWSRFDRVPIDFADPALDRTLVERYEDTHGIRVGGEYALDGGWRVRGGWAWNEAAAPDRTVTPLLPEGPRNQLSAGLGWRISPALGADVSYLRLDQSDRRGRTREVREGELPEDFNTGLYSFAAHLFGATLTLRF